MLPRKVAIPPIGLNFPHALPACRDLNTTFIWFDLQTVQLTFHHYEFASRTYH